MPDIPVFSIAHTNINVRDLERSLTFYREALGLREVRRKRNDKNGFTLAYLTDAEGRYEVELTCLDAHKDEPYDLGENEWHICFRTPAFDEAHRLHEKMGCICFENTEMGLYFIEDPDGYWLEITPQRENPAGSPTPDTEDAASPMAIVLAAGKGTRLHSEQHDLPKVLREAAGRPLLDYVLEKLDFIPTENTVIVIGYRGDQVLKFAGSSYRYALQEELLGTGHAVMMAKDALKAHDGPVLVCYGDMPLITRATYERMFETHAREGNDCTVLAYVTDLDLPYGRIIRDEDGDFREVIEAPDCTPEQLKIRELNAGVYVFDAQKLLKALEGLENDNAQNEYYLTDVPALMLADGGKVGIAETEDTYEGVGVNTQDDLDRAEALLREDQDGSRD